MGRWSEPSLPDSRNDTSVPLKSFLGGVEIEDGVWRNLVRGFGSSYGLFFPGFRVRWKMPIPWGGRVAQDGEWRREKVYALHTFDVGRK